MDGTRVLIAEQIVQILLEKREELLMAPQHKHCVSCGGSTISMVYKSPAAYHVARLLDEYQKQDHPPQ